MVVTCAFGHFADRRAGARHGACRETTKQKSGKEGTRRHDGRRVGEGREKPRPCPGRDARIRRNPSRKPMRTRPRMERDARKELTQRHGRTKQETGANTAAAASRFDPTHVSGEVRATTRGKEKEETKLTRKKRVQEAKGGRKWAARAVLGAAGAGVAAGVAWSDEAEHGMPAPRFAWPHEGFFSAYDHAAIRRGHQVYQQVCAACHSVEQLSYRNLVGVAYTEDEVKEMAAEVDVMDGPNGEGEMFERPGKLSDKLPKPYENEEAARFANGGAYPPDLSLITKARHDGQNYAFALLLGYREPPAGITMREGLHYNPYFPGGAIAMPKMLADEGVEYEDGTVASESQQAKDVVTFLAWAAEPEHDERKLMGVKWMLALSIMLCTAGYFKRWKWSPLKSRKIVLDVVN